MKIIYNNYIPFDGFVAMNFFGILFARKELSETTINHERIHTAQMKEMLYIFFYLFYIIEWLFRIIQYGNFHTAYRNISFETEAYVNERNVEYLQNRKHFSWFKHI